jgi:GT2 family glycosyltransferase
MKIAYCIATWSGARLVETIHTIPEGARLLVVDTSQMCWSLAAAWNYGIRRLVDEGFDYVVVPNDDCLLFPETGEELAAKLAEREDLLMVTARNIRDFQERPGPEERPFYRNFRELAIGAADFSCYCVDRRLFEIVGEFDDAFVPAYFEDNDMHRRIRLAGYEGASWAPFYHYGSTTRNTTPEREEEIAGRGKRFEANKRYYVRKWGGEPGSESFTTPFNGGPRR